MQRDAKHVLSHTAIYLVARGLPGIMAFLSIPLFTRLLDPADYGRYALIIATAGLLNALLFQWLRLSLVRYLPAYKENLGALKSTLATTTFLLIAALGVIGGIACLLPIAHGWRTVIGACWVLLAIQAVYDQCCELSRAAIQPWRYMVLQLIRSTTIIALGAGLVLLGAAWRGPVAATAGGMALAIAWAWRRDWAGLRLILDRPILNRLCQYGIPLSITVALTIVISSSDRFLIAWFRGEADAGLYSVAVDFTSQTLVLLMMVVNLAIFPMAVRAFEHQGKEAAQQQMRTNASLLMAVGLPCVVGLAVLAPGIADCFLGRNFRVAAAGIIPLIALGTFLAGFKAYHFDAAFQFAHRTIYQVWIVLVAAVLNVGLNLLAIPRFGINGAAASSVVAYLVSIALTAYLGRRHFVLPFPIGASMRVVLAAGVMGLLLYPLRNWRSPQAVAAQIVLGAAVYGIVLIGSNFLELRELLLARLAKRSRGPAVPDKQLIVLETLCRGARHGWSCGVVLIAHTHFSVLAMKCICMYTPSSGGGHARYTWELMNALSSQRRGYRFELVTSRDLEEQFKSEQYRIHPILPPLADRDGFANKATWVASRLAHYPRREMRFLSWLRTRPDITGVHVQEWVPWLASSVFRRIHAMGKQIFYTAHNVLPHKYPRWVPKSVMNKWIRTACLQSDALFVHTDRLSQELSGFLGHQHPPIQVVPHGVWTVPDTGNVPSLSERLASRRLLCFGAIRSNKGTDLLLRAMDQLPGFSVTIAGEPYHRDYFQNQILPLVRQLREKGVTVDLIDRFIPDTEVARLFATHSAIVLPYTRGFIAQSGVAFMALAYELPVIASEVGGLRDLFDKFRIGVTFADATPAAVARAVNSLYTGTEHDLISEIRKARRRYSWQETARETIAGYELAVEKVSERNDRAITTTAVH